MSLFFNPDLFLVFYLVAPHRPPRALRPGQKEGAGAPLPKLRWSDSGKAAPAPDSKRRKRRSGSEARHLSKKPPLTEPIKAGVIDGANQLSK